MKLKEGREDSALIANSGFDREPKSVDLTKKVTETLSCRITG